MPAAHSRCRELRRPASKNLQRRKSREGYVESAARAAGEREFRFESTSTAIGLERAHNFNDLARVLLNWDLTFRVICDFKELRVAKTAHSTTPTR